MTQENLTISFEYDPDFPTYAAFLSLDELNDLIDSLEMRIEMNRQAVKSMSDTDLEEQNLVLETVKDNERLSNLKNELENVRDVIGPLGTPDNRSQTH